MRQIEDMMDKKREIDVENERIDKMIENLLEESKTFEDQFTNLDKRNLLIEQETRRCKLKLEEIE